MSVHFLEIQQEYLQQVWLRPSEELEAALPAQLQDDNPSTSEKPSD
jgi:hypothetical protein